VGDVVEKEIYPALLGPIAAQGARQAIVQGIRHFERERLSDDFTNSIGDVVSGIVRRQEAGNICVEIGKAEAILPYCERSPGEEYAAGDRVSCLLLKIGQTQSGPELVLSRFHSRFVRGLLELEVAEIADCTV
jgi:N utilization substance protein A